MKNKNEEILQVLEEKQKCKKCNSELIENELKPLLAYFKVFNDLKENDYVYYKMYCEKCETYTWLKNEERNRR